MITCTICQTQNHHLAVICSSCGSFIQARIENIDLFATSWKVLESPRKAFHTIAVAQHKNYILFLSAVAGIAFTFFTFWVIKAGEFSESLLNILAAGFAVGPVVGILVVLLYAALLTSISHVMRLSVSLKNAYAVTTYALVPIIISVILVLPIEILTFGIYFFTSKPSPYALKPVSYVILLILDGIFTLWSLLLLWVGIKVLLDSSWMKALSVMLISLVIILGICTLVFSMIT
ncbi:MAG: YIP1 family protein [Ignavibacteriae bacterium]|nr:YIP1 family protein [Ignavibacteriota bacterium]